MFAIDRCHYSHHYELISICTTLLFSFESISPLRLSREYNQHFTDVAHISPNYGYMYTYQRILWTNSVFNRHLSVNLYSFGTAIKWNDIKTGLYDNVHTWCDDKWQLALFIQWRQRWRKIAVNSLFASSIFACYSRTHI
jgi:hypothetical protein